jgi:hypothetical protein
VWLGVPTNFQFVFFILSAGGQVRCVYESHGVLIERRLGQKFPEQMIINLAQTACAQGAAKIVKHAYIRNRKSVGQMRKAAPLLLLWQTAGQSIEAKRACQ